MRSLSCRLAFTALAGMMATPALAADEKVYEGTAGNARIVMTLDENGQDVGGHYFYASTRLDIDLSGQHHGTTLTLTSEITKDQITLKAAGANLTGTLVTAKGRSLPVALHPATLPRNLPADLPPKLSLYEQLQVAGLSLVPGPSFSVNGKGLRWYREGLSGLRLFRLESGYPPAAMATINHALAQQQWAEIGNWLTCTGSDGHSGLDSSQADTPWLGTHVMSYTWSSSWSCARAAHPDFGTEGHSFDTATGRELTLDGLLHFGKGPVPAQDSDAWYTYRDKVFAPALVALLQRYHPQEMAPPKKGDDDDCDYTQRDVWNFPSWSLSAKGLWVSASFPRVMRPCDGPEWAIIPWSALPLKP